MKTDYKYSPEKHTVKSLEGDKDYAFWRHSGRDYLTLYDLHLLGPKPEAQGTSDYAITNWHKDIAQDKGSITILLSEFVQKRTILLIDDDDFEFLRSTHKASNERAFQNLQVSWKSWCTSTERTGIPT